MVESNSSSYAAEGEFICANNGVLVDRNGNTFNTLRKTQCLATAEWSNYINYDCRYDLMSTQKDPTTGMLILYVLYCCTVIF